MGGRLRQQQRTYARSPGRIPQKPPTPPQYVLHIHIYRRTIFYYYSCRRPPDDSYPRRARRHRRPTHGRQCSINERPVAELNYRVYISSLCFYTRGTNVRRRPATMPERAPIVTGGDGGEVTGDRAEGQTSRTDVHAAAATVRSRCNQRIRFTGSVLPDLHCSRFHNRN